VSAMETHAESLEAEMLNQPGRTSWMVVRLTAFLTSLGACTRTTKFDATWRAPSRPWKYRLASRRARPAWVSPSSSPAGVDRWSKGW
jgi:hypothetical protein